MRRLCLLVLFLFAFPAAAMAIDVNTLDVGKGRQVWFVEDHSVPVVAVTVSLPAGSAYDPADRPGLAAFAAAMLDEGAGKLNARAFQNALADKAIRLHARVGRDYTVVSVETLAANLPAAMRLLGLALAHPRFDAAAVTRVRARLAQRLRRGENDPAVTAQRAFMTAFFNGHPYGHPPEGEIAAIDAVTPAELRGFARAHWVKGGLKVVIAGDTTADAATKLVAATFAALPGTIPAAPPPVGRLGRPGVHTVPTDSTHTAILFGLPGIMRKNPDFIAGYVANTILGGRSFTSRLAEAVRIKRGLAYDIRTDLTTWRRASVLEGRLATRPDAVPQTLKAVRQVMAGFAANGPTPQELNDAKAFLTGTFPLALTSDAGIAARLGAFQRQGLDTDYAAKHNALIQAVTLDDVRRVAKKLYDPTHLTIIVAGPSRQGSKPAGPGR